MMLKRRPRGEHKKKRAIYFTIDFFHEKMLKGKEKALGKNSARGLNEKRYKEFRTNLYPLLVYGPGPLKVSLLRTS